MGCSFSCKRSPKSKNIRIIHINGYIEEIEYPVTVGEVTGNPGKHFLFTQAQLLAAGSAPLKLDTPLEPGRVYFLLPFSLFDSSVSPVDLAPLARKLASVAQNTRPGKPSRQISDNGKAVYGGSGMEKSIGSWKPILSTIRERSFNRRESDLQEYGKVE